MTTQFKPGDRVRVIDKTATDYGSVGTVIQAGVATAYIKTINHYCTFMNDQLTLLNPPTPKRVEVVTETRTFETKYVKFELKLPVSMLKAFTESQYCPTELHYELLAALTENANG